jgi:inward rectifier potassium channel|tara:strand:+ start:1475 stop:2392 length:918 start_codon:yes stop_codon:yes gene_type:complete
MPKEIKDPGIGTKIDEKVRRMINSDGSYNVIKKGSTKGIRDIFKYLVEISWTWFFTILFIGYIIFNLIFSLIYAYYGAENILGTDPANGPIFFQIFFFSIQTFTTVGYGTLAPLGIATQIIAAIEAFVGFMSFSLATGLLYGRFSRPRSKLMFADNFVFSKYEDGYSFKFKLTNLRDVVLQDVEAKIITMFNKENKAGKLVRTYYEVPLTLPKLDIMALTWTLVHKIDKDSPFWERNKEEIIKQQPEFLIFVNGFDEIYSERTRARKSYVADDIIWNKNFATNFKSLDNGKLVMDVRDLNNVIDE